MAATKARATTTPAHPSRAGKPKPAGAAHRAHAKKARRGASVHPKHSAKAPPAAPAPAAPPIGIADAFALAIVAQLPKKRRREVYHKRLRHGVTKEGRTIIENTFRELH